MSTVLRLLVALLGLAAAGCAATITCPEVPDADKRGVFLLDHGKHASLVLARADGSAVRYSYGDRRWYAEGDTGIGAGFSALFRATPAVLMRRVLPRSGPLDAVVRATGFEVEHAYVLPASAARVDALAEALEAMFAAGGGDPGSEFAPHPSPYTLRHNSNHVVAAWLEELGCETRGSPMTSNWRVAD